MNDDPGSKNDLPSLEHYRRLIGRLDAFSDRVHRRYGEHIACREGCADCCTLGSVFAVEAYSILRSLEEMTEGQREKLHARAARRAEENRTGDRCIFLFDDRCLVYGARPVICRTHGNPLLVQGKVDFCPKNFTSLSNLESECILDLDALNTALTAVNIAFALEIGKTADVRFSRERIALRDLVGF